MSKRGPGPTLYDLIQSSPRSGGDAEVAERRTAQPDVAGPPSPTGASILQPGRQIVVPVGVVLVAVAVFLGGVIGAYALGHFKGDQAARVEFEAARAEESNQLLNERAIDPLGQGSPAGNSGGVPMEPRNSGGSASVPGGSTDGSPPGRWGQIDDPPLQAGFSYFIVAETRSDGARRLAEFLRSEGLEAYVILGNNAGSRDRVVVFPGMEDLKSSVIRAELEQAIRLAGRKWKAANRGESDLSDFYPLRYDG